MQICEEERRCDARMSRVKHNTLRPQNAGTARNPGPGQPMIMIPAGDVAAALAAESRATSGLTEHVTASPVYQR